MAEALPPEILAHYARGQEAARLSTGKNQLELARTQEPLARRLDEADASVDAVLLSSTIGLSLLRGAAAERIRAPLPPRPRVC